MSNGPSESPSALQDWVDNLRAQGVVLRAEGGRLVVTAPKGVVDAALAAQLKQRKSELIELLQVPAQQAIGLVERGESLALGLVQQRMWLHNQIEPDTILYNLPAAWKLTGALDQRALGRAIDAVVARHEVLRSRVSAASGEPRQTFVQGGSAFVLDCTDLSTLEDEQRQASLARHLEQLRDDRIDLERDAPFRAALFRLSQDAHVLFFMPHHVVWDGWSFDIFLRDLNELYKAETQPGHEARLPALPIQYVDYVVWHREWMHSGPVHSQTEHWLKVLANPPVALELPCDYARPRLFDHRGDWVEFHIPAETVERVTRLAAQHRATSFMVMLTAWFAFLLRHSGQTDIVIGVPIQARQRSETTDLIGCFVNTLCLRVQLDPNASFVQLLEAVREACLDAFEHQEAPVEMLTEKLVVRRDPSRTPLFQAMFNHQQVSRRPTHVGDLVLDQVHVNPAATPTELMLAVMEGSAGARGVMLYSSALFAPQTAQRFAQRYLALLDSALATPAQAIGELSLWLDAEQAQLDSWNSTTQPFLKDQSAAALLATALEKQPDIVALRCADASMTRGELQAAVHRLAGALRDRGVGRGDLVGLCLKRSIEMVVAQLAILEAGAAYVPLDPGYPGERLAYMAEDAALALLVTQSDLVQTFAWPAHRTLLLDAEAGRIAARTGDPLPHVARHTAQPEDPAYVIYTSGSTGKPKGVVVPHRALVNFLAAMQERPGLQAGDRLVAVTTLSFDIAVLELLLPLAVGAEVVLATQDQVFDGGALRRLLEASDATTMQATPSTWRMLIEAGWKGHAQFKALIGGEALPADLASLLLARTGELWNMYGPTETTVWSTCWKVEQPEQGISIGTPIANTQVHVLDAQARLCPIGVAGEICIGGDGVTTGYLGRAELTAERFIADPFVPGARLYRTGDRGRWRADGLLEHLGRLDFQVKVRGYRIELGEIEANLARYSAVQRNVVIVREDRPGDMRIVAYVVPNGEMPVAAALREHLRTSLPDYMIPQHFVRLDSVPLLPNGKVDRTSLPAPDEDRAPVAANTAALKGAERDVALIWASALGIDDVRGDDYFFDLGGHSLLAMQVAAKLAKELGMQVAPRRFIFENLRQIAATSIVPPSGLVLDGSAAAGRSPGRVKRLLKSVSNLIGSR